ncbi:hypothetical protein NQ317_005925 [Molorchus minor]|uniref:GYF domain-containing protein n=1 Tax=Molorchus minor TaxID=1323400 RepID=A0ABQ9JFP9_9CUCU|nr:hypothetical protein NQ317_005925 [Molorchus minor]
MTDSMNFGPDWIRNLSSEGTTGSGSSGGTRYQLADYRYGREEMLALFDRNSKPPASIPNFKRLYSETSLLPLALLPATDEEANNRGGWQGRPTSLSGPPRGRGGSLERGGRISRGRGYQYSRASGYESGWGNGEQPDWSPRKEYNQRTMSMDNWRRSRIEEDDGWRNISQGRGMHEKWGRSTSWRGEGGFGGKSGPPERGSRTNWHDGNRAPSRRSWDDDHLPEWATENPTEGGGTFDERGAFHGSDDEQLEGKPPNKRDTGLQKSTSQQYISSKSQHPPLSTSKSTMSLINKSEEHMKNEEDPPEEYNEEEVIQKENSAVLERKKSVPNIPDKVDREVVVQERAKSEGPPKLREKQQILTNGPIHDLQRNEESDFERLQEDFVLKLVVDEELPKQTPNNFEVGGLQPPPNLVAQPIHDRWFYQDPQGQMQGPFSNIEMAEWYKAGYFSNQLKVRRQCDERFYLLGELIAICGGQIPSSPVYVFHR